MRPELKDQEPSKSLPEGPQPTDRKPPPASESLEISSGAIDVSHVGQNVQQNGEILGERAADLSSRSDTASSDRS